MFKKLWNKPITWGQSIVCGCIGLALSLAEVCYFFGVFDKIGTFFKSLKGKILRH